MLLKQVIAAKTRQVCPVRLVELLVLVTLLAEREASEPPGDGTHSESREFHLTTASFREMGGWV